MSVVCPAPGITGSLLQPVSATVHYILTGTFNTLFLYLLAFNPTQSTLTVHKTIRAEGPHQYIALGADRSTAYATTWAQPPTLSAWQVLDGGRTGIEHINTVPITATSSYISVSPLDPPRIYSAGGPTGEMHAIDERTGGLGEKLQQLLYVEPDQLEKEDKTRVALRYGSHGIDLNLPRKQMFVPHLGHNSIFMYDVLEDGQLSLVANCPSHASTEPNAHEDGPRHNIPSPDGSKLYVVTEHTSYLDVYSITSTGLSHTQRLSVLPPQFDSQRFSHFRGDTLRLSPSGRYLYVTTRGKTPATKGWISVFRINEQDGSVSVNEEKEEQEVVVRWQTGTSGGKANAIEVFPFRQQHVEGQGRGQGRGQGQTGWRDWILLTDDEQGFVSVLEFDGREMSEVAQVQLGLGGSDEEKATGASHAVWLS